MAKNSRTLSLALAAKVYRFFLQAFPGEFRAHMGEDVTEAFKEGCGRALKRRGLLGLLGYAGRGCRDAVKEGLAERVASSRRGRERAARPTGLHGDWLVQDLRFAFRTLRRRPVFAGVAILTLALGIGSATAIFSVVNGVLLKPFPYPDAEQLVVLWNTNPERGQDEFRMAGLDYFEVERSTSSFSGMALAAGGTANLTDDDLPPIRVEGALVSADFFTVLGVPPLMGRSFRAEENQGDHRVVILSYGLWAGRFGKDSDIIGKRIEMDGISREVVGVMPRVSLPIGGSTLTLPGPDTSIFWRPLDYSLDWVSEFRAHVLSVLARMEPGTELERAQADVASVAAALVEGNTRLSGQGILLRSLKDQVVGDVRRNLVILMAAVGLLLLLACGNVTSLLLARAKDREKELSIRSAIGAGRSRLVRQILTETFLLSLVGGVLGLVVARWGSAALMNLVPSSLPRQSEVGVDTAVLLFNLTTVLFASALAILIPTFRLSRRDALAGLKVGGREGTPGRERNQANRVIVVGQLTLATLLLFGAGLLFRSLQTLEGVDPGFRKEGVLTAQLMLPDLRYGGSGEVLSFYGPLREGIGGLPGVSMVALGMDHPLETSWWNGFTLLDRPAADPTQSTTAIFRPVSDGYFEAMGIPVLQGRAFESGDGWGDHPVMVVNQEFVERYFRGESPLGERIEFLPGRFIWGDEAPTVFEVVGVVGDVRFNGLREPSEPAFHIPMNQFPYSAVKLMVGTSVDPESLAGLVQEEIWRLDPDLPVTDVWSMDQIFASAVAQDRFNVILLEVFALAALLLAAAGIYGVLNNAVSQRRAELGIRMALGARSASVLGMVVRDAALMGGLGLVSGLTLSLALTRFLGSLLFQVPAHDTFVVAVVCPVLALVSLGSGLIPALKAARTDPMEALRAE